MGTFSIWHWLIVLLVVVLVFGSKKLVEAGPNLGEAIRGFRKSVQEDDKSDGGKTANASAALGSREKSDSASTAENTTAS